MLSIYVGSLFLAFMVVSTCAFIEQPTTVLKAPGTLATFRCRHEDPSVHIGWQVNGTSIGQVMNSDIIPGTIRDDTGHLVDVLTILALPEYNNTEVQCLAVILVPNITTELTPIAKLIIQEGLNDSAATTTSEASDGFIEVPLPITVPIGAEATFRCRHNGAQVIDWNINGRSLGNYIPPNVTQNTLSSPEGFVHTLSILALEHYNETYVECVAIIFLDNMSINQRRQKTSSVVLLIQGPLTAIINFVKMNFSLVWSPPFSLDLSSSDPDIVYCIDIYNNSCISNSTLIISNCSIVDSVYPYNSPQEIGLLEYVVTPRSNAEGVINGTPSVLKERYFSFDASNLVAVVSKSNRSTADVMLSLKYSIILTSDNLRKTLTSYLVRLESVDSGQPATKEYNVSSSNEIRESGIILQVSDTLQSGRIWNCVVTPATCKDIFLLDNTEISTHDIQNINISATSSSNGIIISSKFINRSQASGMFIIAYSLAEDSDIHYSVNIRLYDQQTLVTELKGLSGNKYNISVFALMDGLPFIRAALKSKSITASNSKLKEGVTIKHSSSIQDCLLAEDSTSINSNICISCSLTNTAVGTCVVVVHIKPLLLRNSYRGLQDISVIHLNNSAVDSRCSGCIDGVSLNDYVMVVFLYLNGTIVSDSHAFVRQQPSSNTDGGSLIWIFRIAIPSVCGGIITIVVAVLIIFVVLYNITKIGRKQTESQKDVKRIKVKRCAAYEVTKVKLEENPSYEERKVFEGSINMNRCTAYEAAKLAREELPMEHNPAYGELVARIT